MAWCGWQWDVIRSPALMGLEAPQALGEDGKPIVGWTSVEFQLNLPVPDKLLADRVHHPYTAASLDQPDATLTVRDWQGGERTTIARERWRFAHDEGGQPVPDDSHVWLEGGFEAGKVYEVVYQTNTCPVVGTGLLAVRDFTSFVRHATAEDGNPSAGRIERTYGYGVSQSGRFLRHFLYLGLNLDEAGHQVYDGLLVQVAGARRGHFNHRYAQPSNIPTPSLGLQMPFADDPQTDPVTGQHGGMLDRQRALGGVPKGVAINTSAEDWRGDSSLLHTDIAGSRDVEPAAGSRIYLMSSTQHGPGSLPLQTLSPNEGSRGVHGFNAIDYSPLIRAALVNLDRWVSDGAEPPPNAYPRIDDGTAVRQDVMLARFRTIPGATVPDPERLPTVWRADLGPDAERGVLRPPARLGQPYRNLVSQVDGDGNEMAGIRMPDVGVPVATYTGWNPRDPSTGGGGQIIPMQGSTLPFPATRQERERRNDPRLSIEERYRDREDYAARVRAAAEDLNRQGYLLDEDVDLAVELALVRYDAFASAPAGVSR